MPAHHAQPVVDQVVDAGIKAISELLAGALKVPVEVKLKSVDLTVSLESLSFYLAQGERTERTVKRCDVRGAMRRGRGARCEAVACAEAA